MAGSRRLGISDFTHLLATLRATRDEMNRVAACYPIRHPIARNAHNVVQDIDALGTLVTGDIHWWEEKANAMDRLVKREQ